MTQRTWVHTVGRVLVSGIGLLGIGLLGPGLSGLAQAAPGNPDKPDKPPTLDPRHVLCGEQFRPAPRDKAAPLQQCMDAAAAFYKEEWQPQVQGLMAGDARGLEPLRAATTFELPDGTLIGGLAVWQHLAALFGPNAGQLLSVSDDFTFKPIDADTIMVFGVPRFTMKGRDGATFALSSAQLSVYRRTHSGVPARGWEELGEFWTYQSPTKGPKPTLPPAPSPAAPAAQLTP